MPFSKEICEEIFGYCQKHIGDQDWFNEEFEFIEDEQFRSRIGSEFKGVRFAYKMYEGIGAKDENLIFEVRHQILSYASIYEAVIHYVLYNYYRDTTEFHEMQYHIAPTKMGYQEEQIANVAKLLHYSGADLMIYHLQERKKDESQVRFDDKCKTAEKLGLIKKYINSDGLQIDLPSEIIEIYGYRNAIHLVAEQRKGIEYELELSKKAYWRLRPFVDQIKEKLIEDKKSIYKSAEI